MPDPGSECVQAQKPLATGSGLPVGTSAQACTAETRLRPGMDVMPAQAHLTAETAVPLD